MQSWLKDLCQKVRKALLDKDETARKTTTASIATMIAEQADSLEASSTADQSHSASTQPSGPSNTAQIRAQISAKINSTLLDVFHGELESQQQQKLPAVVDLLHVLLPLLGTQSIVLEWWDLALRPLLKNAAVQNVTASRARELVVKAMAAAPSSAYEDEPAPVQVWPPPTEKIGTRKAGDAPYRLGAAPPQSPPGKADSEKMPGSSVPKPSSATLSAQTRVDMHRRFTQRIFDLYLSETATKVSGKAEGDDAHGDEKIPINSGGELGLTTSFSEDETSTVWKGNLESTILIYSNEKPKEFFHHMAESFAEPTARVSLLCLLATFLRLYPIHAYHITSTALPKQLVLSLQLDTSTTSTSLGVTTLAMLLPHIPDWIASGGAGGLPTLLSIYGRIVDWRKLGAGWENRVGTGPELEALRREHDEEYSEVDRIGKRLNIKASLRWRRLETDFDSEDPAPPNAEQLFTFLYGLFPCNVIRFLRAPVYYLRQTMFDSPFEGAWEDMIDEMAIQTRSHPIMARHTLHASLISMDAERELTDKQRWMKHDSADINAECMSLFLGKWHDVSDDHIRQAERERQGSMDADHLDDESASCISEKKPQASEMSRRRSTTTTHHAGSHIGSIARTFRHIPHVVSADDILLTYASLRSGAPLTSGVVGSADVHSRDLLRTGGPGHPVTFAPVSRGIPISVASTTAAMTAATASASHVPPSSMPPSPITQAARSRTRRSGSLSSVISLLPSASSPPTSSSGAGKHPLAASHIASEHDVRPMDRMLEVRSARTETSSELAFVQRENLLLRNELNFELYLKEQHLRHIGKLHRDRVTDTALEAERQNLYHTVRALRSQLTSMNATLERQRAEAASTKARHVHWEAALNNKVKAYREERKAWMSEARQLKAQAEENAATIAGLSRQLEESGSELFELKTRLASVEPKVAKIEQYEAKLAQLSTCLTHWDADVLRYEEQRREMHTLLARWDELLAMLASTEHALRAAEERAAALEADNSRLDAQLKAAAAAAASAAAARAQPPATETQTPPSAVSTLASIEKERDALRSQNEDLAATILDLKAKLEMSTSSVTDEDVPPMSIGEAS